VGIIRIFCGVPFNTKCTSTDEIEFKTVPGLAADCPTNTRVMELAAFATDGNTCHAQLIAGHTALETPDGDGN
jgi:hypothetical protein